MRVLQKYAKLFIARRLAIPLPAEAGKTKLVTGYDKFYVLGFKPRGCNAENTVLLRNSTLGAHLQVSSSEGDAQLKISK